METHVNIATRNDEEDSAGGFSHPVSSQVCITSLDVTFEVEINRLNDLKIVVKQTKDISIETSTVIYGVKKEDLMKISNLFKNLAETRDFDI